MTKSEAGALGGKATARNRTKKQRSDAARKAAIGRWHKCDYCASGEIAIHGFHALGGGRQVECIEATQRLHLEFRVARESRKRRATRRNATVKSLPT
jgi:hypothetical protein